MKNSPYNGDHNMHLLGLLILMLCLGPSMLLAEESNPEKVTTPIEIAADQVVTDSTAHTAEFSGNVTATQGQTKITADRLILYYGSPKKGLKNESMNDINKIEAIGQVRILLDNRVAVSDQAIYTTFDRQLILRGRRPKSLKARMKFQEGKSSLTGTVKR